MLFPLVLSRRHLFLHFKILGRPIVNITTGVLINWVFLLHKYLPFLLYLESQCHPIPHCCFKSLIVEYCSITQLLNLSIRFTFCKFNIRLLFNETECKITDINWSFSQNGLIVTLDGLVPLDVVILPSPYVYRSTLLLHSKRISRPYIYLNTPGREIFSSQLLLPGLYSDIVIPFGVEGLLCTNRMSTWLANCIIPNESFRIHNLLRKLGGNCTVRYNVTMYCS